MCVNAVYNRGSRRLQVGRRDGTRLPQPLQVSIHFAEIQGFGRLFLGEHSQPVPTAPVAIEYQYQYI